MAYGDDINALNPDHRWAFNGSDGTDSAGSATATMTGTVSAVALCEDVANSAQTNTIAGDRMSLGSVVTISNAAQSRKCIGGWFKVSKINAHPVRIYGEGASGLCFQMIMALGNNCMLEVFESTAKQVYGLSLVPGREYHLCGVVEGTGYNDRVEFFIDGVSQGAVALGAASLSARTPAEFADPAGSVGVGGDVVLLQAPVNGSYNEWASWSNKTLPTDTEIREELFEKGAVPSVTITNQTQLDALADTVRPNEPLCIRVDVAGSISLDADNITFDPQASIHVQYTGTGTLTWTNSNGSDASIGSTPNGGSIAFNNPATLTVTGLIDGAEVRIYDNEVTDYGNNNTELAGIESNSGTTFQFSHTGATNSIRIQMIASGYEEVLIDYTLSSSDQSVQVFPEEEFNL